MLDEHSEWLSFGKIFWEKRVADESSEIDVLTEWNLKSFLDSCGIISIMASEVKVTRLFVQRTTK